MPLEVAAIGIHCSCCLKTDLKKVFPSESIIGYFFLYEYTSSFRHPNIVLHFFKTHLDWRCKMHQRGSLNTQLMQSVSKFTIGIAYSFSYLEDRTSKTLLPKKVTLEIFLNGESRSDYAIDTWFVFIRKMLKKHRATCFRNLIMLIITDPWKPNHRAATKTYFYSQYIYIYRL